jgi:hypothetical protein
MISGLSAQGKYMYIHGGHSSGPYVNNNNTSAGMVRYNNNNLEVYDGSAWLIISGSIGSVGLNGIAESAIDWAVKKMVEEQEWEELAKTSKAVTIALENLNKVKAELKLIALLAKEQNEETTS